MNAIRKTFKSHARLSGAMLIVLTLVFACNQDDDLFSGYPEDSDVTQEDSREEVLNDDSDDLAFSALSSIELTGGKLKDTDDRFDCAEVTRTGDSNAGTLRIDFGAGCTDKRDNVRKGAIVISYTGRWNVAGSSWTISFDNYFLNDVAIGGVRTVTNVTENENLPAFDVVLENGSMTFPDGKVASRKAHHRREHELDANNVLKRLIIYGTAEGSNRNGRGYQIEILDSLIYDRTCPDNIVIPVSGKKKITHGERQITVDFGKGDCDNTVVITNMNGKSWSFTVSR